MIYIFKVHYEKDEHGCDVITQVFTTVALMGGVETAFSKNQIIQKIEYGEKVKTKYLSANVYAEGDDVIVVDDSYIRTDGNQIKEDNLGNLPKY